jgi:hypothetical protein
MELLSGYGKRGVDLGLLTKQADLNDTEYLSKYFVLQEFSPEFTAGKNSVTFNGSEYLKKGSEVLVECVDSAGEPLYIEATTKTSLVYKESSAYILSIHVYAETSNGPGKLILYGTAINGATVKWVGNISIDKTKSNISTVRFYNKPTLEVNPILSPVLAHVGDLNKQVEVSGSFYSFAVAPSKDTPKLSKRNVDIDYRIYAKNLPVDVDPTGSFNSQLKDVKVDFRVKTIQEPFSYKNTNVDFTTSLSVKKVINNSTIIVNDVISYKDRNKNDIVINVVDGEFFVKYPYIVYNTASESQSYLTTNVKDGQTFVKQSYADVIYKNLRTFSGFIARHKLYRKSLFSPGDFEVISDEPLTSGELLQDKLTTNKSFDKMGSFYNQRHVNKYWFTGSNNLSIVHSSNKLIDAVNINTVHENIQYNSLSNYIILKDNASYLERNANYFPYNLSEFLSTSGSSYDSNFIELKKNVNYIVSLNAILRKDSTSLSETDAGLEFYFTSSLSVINLETNAVKNQKGLLKLGSISAYEPIGEKVYTKTSFMFSLANDLYGTLVIVPRKCSAIISELSMKPYGDSGFSPDTLITRIPFPINIANEAFEIKSELFDVNSNLVYSDLRTVTSFDPSGSSLSVYIPGLKDPNKTTFLSGSLLISQSLWVGENAYITGTLLVGGAVTLEGIQESSYTSERMLTWHPTTNQVTYTNINDIDHDGTKTIKIKLYEKNSPDTTTNVFRLIPSVEGRNVSVLDTNTSHGGGQNWINVPKLG